MRPVGHLYRKRVDHLMFFNSVLSGEEVQSIYAAQAVKN
jgi:hypothetical protein